MAQLKNFGMGRRAASLSGSSVALAYEGEGKGGGGVSGERWTWSDKPGSAAG